MNEIQWQNNLNSYRSYNIYSLIESNLACQLSALWPQLWHGFSFIFPIVLTLGNFFSRWLSLTSNPLKDLCIVEDYLSLKSFYLIWLGISFGSLVIGIFVLPWYSIRRSDSGYHAFLMPWFATHHGGAFLTLNLDSKLWVRSFITSYLGNILILKNHSNK